MATVVTYKSESELQAAVGGTVTTYKDEATLDAYLDTITSEVIIIVVKGGSMYTVITDPTASFLPNATPPIFAKGAFYTVLFA